MDVELADGGNTLKFHVEGMLVELTRFPSSNKCFANVFLSAPGWSYAVRQADTLLDVDLRAGMTGDVQFQMSFSSGPPTVNLPLSAPLQANNYWVAYARDDDRLEYSACGSETPELHAMVGLPSAATIMV
jgi:hypothetical protein